MSDRSKIEWTDASWALDFAALRTLTGDKAGITDAACPLCGPSCKGGVNRKRKVLRIWDADEFITYKCARCEAAGWARDDSAAHRTAPRAKAEQRSALEKDKSEIARLLWSRSLPLAGSFAETYLRSRQCFIDTPAIRFLPRRGDHCPAMITRFGSGVLTGVHLTRLKDDGSAKAGTDLDKITLGPSVGQPIILRDNPERDELVIAEGIEDAATLANAFDGWSAWAAGSSGRIATVLPGAHRFALIVAAIDGDPPRYIEKTGSYMPGAGTLALQRARAVRADIVPIRFDRIVPRKHKPDANKVMMTYGPETLRDCLDVSLAQAEYRRGQLGFEAMAATVNRIAFKIESMVAQT